MTHHRHYLLLDTSLINPQQSRNARLRLRQAVKDPAAPLLGEDYFADPPRPWEARFDNGYPHVFWDSAAGLFRLYYTVFIIDEASTGTSCEDRPDKRYAPGPERTAALCYAESRDGVTWIKPELGLVEFQGSSANNIVMRNAHGTSVVLDELDPEPSRRYKLITKLEYSSTHHFMAVAFSPDGLHFSNPRPWPRFNPRADTHNFAYWDEVRREFGLITRLWSGRLRVAAKAESHDFVSWSEPREVFRGQGFAEQVYSMPVMPYAQGYLGFPAMFHEGDRAAADFDLVDTRLTFSADGEHWEIVCPDEAVIPRGLGRYPTGDFDNGCVYASAPVALDGRLAVYYIGSNGPHTDFREGALGLAWLDEDKFAFYGAADPTDEWLLATAPFSVFGDELDVLVEVDPGGYLEVELRRDTVPIEGFGRNETRRIAASGWARMVFSRGTETLAGEKVSFWFHGRGARIFALRGTLESIPRP